MIVIRKCILLALLIIIGAGISCIPLGHYSTTYNSGIFPKLTDFDRSGCEPVSFYDEYEYNDIVVIAELHPNYTVGNDKSDILIKVLDFYKGRGEDLIPIHPGA